MEQLAQNKSITRKKYYLIYSGIFLFCAFCICLYLYLNGKTNINFVSDGMNQHYRALLYYSRYLKQIINNLYLNHSFEIPLWDFSIGEGADIINTFHSDAIGDPLTFLSVLVPERYMPLYYLFNTFIRIYLSGIFFSMFCFYTGQKNDYAVLAGAIAYSFCFWSIQSITLHIYFLTPLMYLPLLLLGVEKIINDDKPYVFVVAVLLSSISWLYFFYMEALATAIYGVIRVIYKYRTDIKSIITKLFTILVFAILGVMMAMIVLCPMIFAYMGDSRMGIKTNTPLLYDRFFYERLFTIFLSNDSPYDFCMGFVSATLFAIALTIKNYKKNTLLLIMGFICFISVCIPMLGKVWNGFSYVSQRWSFVIAMPVSYALTASWGDYRDNRKYLLLLIPLLIGLSLFTPWSRTERVFVPMALGLVFLGVAISKIDKKLFGCDLKQIIMIAIMIVNIFYIFDFNLSPRGGDVIDDLLSIEEIKDFNRTSEAYVMKESVDDDSFYRYSGSHLTNNASTTFGTHSVNFYWSITNPSDQKFRMLLDLKDRLSWQLMGYDNRAQLETLANVKYYITDDSYEGIIPYGYELKNSSNGYKIYENRHALPFGYTYDKTISYDEWYKQNALQKQEMMFKAVTIEKGNNSVSALDNISDTKYSIEALEGVEINGNTIDVKEKNGTIVLKLSEKENVDNYITIEGLKYEDTYSVVENDQTESKITIETSNGITSVFNHATPTHRYFHGKSDYINYLGFSEKAINQIRISFSLIGRYTFDDMHINCVDMSDYESDIRQLSKDHLNDVLFETNKVSGMINLDSNKILLLSIPYSKGWSAKVDGEKAELLRANEHYMALDLGSGNHAIELNYMTPGLKIGAVISCVSMIVFIAYIIINETKENNKKI